MDNKAEHPKSSIDVSVAFDYRGVSHNPASTIDLDALMENHASLAGIHRMLANANNIDTYSYEYEIMQVSEIAYDNPQGLAKEFASDGGFDIAGFEQAWHTRKKTTLVTELAQKIMGRDDFDEQPKLIEALLAAYDAGKNSENSQGAV